MSYQTMNQDWCKALIGTYNAVPIDDDYHDESDIGPGAHRFATTKIRYRRSWTRRCTTKAERDAIVAYYAAHRTVVFHYWQNLFDSTTHLVRFSKPVPENPLFGDGVWDIEFEVEDV